MTPILAAAVIAAGIATAGPEAPEVCGPHDDITAYLAMQYHEKLRAQRIDEKTGEHYELFMSPENTWTIIVTTADGRTCVFAAGANPPSDPGVEV